MKGWGRFPKFHLSNMKEDGTTCLPQMVETYISTRKFVLKTNDTSQKPADG